MFPLDVAGGGSQAGRRCRRRWPRARNGRIAASCEKTAPVKCRPLGDESPDYGTGGVAAGRKLRISPMKVTAQAASAMKTNTRGMKKRYGASATVARR